MNKVARNPGKVSDVVDEFKLGKDSKFASTYEFWGITLMLLSPPKNSEALEKT